MLRLTSSLGFGYRLIHSCNYSPPLVLIPFCSQSPCLDQFSTHFLVCSQPPFSLSVYNLVVLGLKGMGSSSLTRVLDPGHLHWEWSLNHCITRKIPQSPSPPFFLFAFPRAGSKPSFRVFTPLVPPVSSSSSSASLASSSPLPAS